MKTKLFTLLFAVAASVGTMFAERVKIGDLYYNLDAVNKTAEVTYEEQWDNANYSGLTTANIPSSVDYESVTYSVTSIGGGAFYGCTGLTSVTIPNSVTSIGEDAFSCCTGLTSVTIPNSVTSIGEEAFSWCSSLTSVTIPNSVTSIGEYAFYGCTSLTSVTIPNSVTSIGDWAFSNCTGLTSPVYNAHVFAFMPTSYSGAYTIPDGIESIAGGAFYNCRGLTSVTIPNSVTSIGSSAFGGCTGLTSITIPNSITSIGNGAFERCSGLTSVTIPNSVTSIGERAFAYCTGLTSIIWNAKNCNGYNFGSQVESFVFGNEVESIPAAICSGMTKLTSVTIPNSVTSIGNRAFDGCTNLTDIYATCGDLDRIKKLLDYDNRVKYQPLPYTITVKNAPNGKVNYPQNICDALEITATPDRGYYFVKWADGNTENPRTIELTQDTTMEAIFDYLLTGKCGKDNELNWKFDPSTMALNISKAGSLTENYTYGTFMELLTIGNEITIIGQSAFAGCGNLRTVILGSSVKVLEENAFNGCTALETITCYSQRPPTVNNYALYGLDYSTIVYVPADYLETYKMHDAWGLYDVRSLGATTTQTNEVTVEPTETTAEVAWPTVSGAYTYDLVIKDKAGNPVCTLTFNANGQLTSIAFHAPARNHSQQQTQAAGFSFTVTGLEAGTTYDLTITAKDNNGTTIDEKALSFTTASQSMSIDETVNRKSSNRKLIIGGHLYILRDGKMYNVQGAEVK